MSGSINARERVAGWWAARQSDPETLTPAAAMRAVGKCLAVAVITAVPLVFVGFSFLPASLGFVIALVVACIAFVAVASFVVFTLVGYSDDSIGTATSYALGAGALSIPILFVNGMFNLMDAAEDPERDLSSSRAIPYVETAPPIVVSVTFLVVLAYVGRTDSRARRSAAASRARAEWEAEQLEAARAPSATTAQPIGFVGSLAAAGTGYVVLIYMGIPSVIITLVAPPIGLPLCGLTLWVAFRSGRSVGRATYRGVTAASARLEEALARFLSEYRAYQREWGDWTPPGDADEKDQSSGWRPPPSAHEDATPSPFAVLGVPDGAPLKEAQVAYHRLIIQLHPDRNMTRTVAERTRLEDQAKVITEAYNAIKEQYRPASA